MTGLQGMRSTYVWVDETWEWDDTVPHLAECTCSQCAAPEDGVEACQ